MCVVFYLCISYFLFTIGNKIYVYVYIVGHQQTYSEQEITDTEIKNHTYLTSL
jgi:hypothetical protein